MPFGWPAGVFICRATANGVISLFRTARPADVTLFFITIGQVIVCDIINCCGAYVVRTNALAAPTRPQIKPVLSRADCGPLLIAFNNPVFVFL